LLSLKENRMAATLLWCLKIANILKNLILLYLFGVLLKNSQDAAALVLPQT
jgi:hypothetical protein